MTQSFVEEQSAPVPNDKPASWDLVVADMRARDAVGRERYGTPLQPGNGRDSLVDAYQEVLDAAVYLRNAIAERGVEVQSLPHREAMAKEIQRLRAQVTELQAGQTRLVEERRELTPRTLTALRDRATRTAKEHGFHNTVNPPVMVASEMIALMHSELSEALEDMRAGHGMNETWLEPREPLPKPCGVPSEIADVIIRALDFCGRFNIDIEQAVLSKMAFNDSRPFKHGKVF